VVEDDTALRAFYTSALMFAGYRAVPAADGTEALNRLDQERPAAIVLDIALPKLSGLDVARELRAHADWGAIPIVIVTATDVRAIERSLFACVLEKPVMPDELVDAVTDCIRRRRG
jgi:DNA-binding response OmpR family regulator